ncbi:MAG: YceI family protein [Pseudomonadota bacterium]|nr:MAG: polyisoprenoid-binding protein [Pseudomonadota bacterium]
MESKNWNLDLAHSAIHFSVRHMVFAKVRGRFGSFRGTLDIDEADLTRSSVRAEIDAASIDTGVADRDNHLRSADFLDTERFPHITFESKRVEKTGDNRYRVTGNLTIRDVTREVALDVEHGGVAKDPWGNQRTAFTATTSIDRRDFGLKWNQALEAGGVLVGERVDIEIEVQAVRTAATQVA